MKWISKRNFLNLSPRSFIALSLLISLSSCSWISSRRTLFGDEDEEKKNAQIAKAKEAAAASSANGTVSRAEFEELQRKYQELKQRNESPADRLDRLRAQGFEDPSELVDQLNQVAPQPALAETVDVFSQTGTNNRGLVRKAPPPVLGFKQSVGTRDVSPEEMEYQIQELQRAQSLMAQNKFDATLQIVKKLENSPVRQVKVRAKFIFGELLFAQQEYDLAMQVYEEIIRSQAFSGIVIKTLGRLAACSDKLKLKQKKDQYFSLLNQFLGSV